MRLTPEERQLRSIQNIERLAALEQEQNRFKLQFKQSAYFKLSFTFRLVLIAFTTIGLYPEIYPETDHKIISGIKSKEYYTGRFTGTKHSYTVLATQDGHYFPISRVNDHFNVGDTISTFNNILSKKSAIVKKNDDEIHILSAPIPAFSGLLIISVFSLMTFQRYYFYDKRRINFILIMGSFSIIWYYVEFLITI